MRVPMLALFGLVGWLLCSACVFLAPPIDYGPHCQLQGSSECATCLRESCQAQIDACCDDTSCRGYEGSGGDLEALDSCAKGDVDACRSGIQSSWSSSGEAVRACLATSCSDACLEGATIAVAWSCDAPRAPSTECAECIYDECADIVDECCGDASCGRKGSEIAQDMGACVGGDAPGCVYLAERSMGGYEGKLRACIQESCASACFPADGRAHTRCTLFGGGSWCTCTYQAKSSGPECSTEAIGGGDCVEGEDGCFCGVYGCEVGSGRDSCACDFRGSGESTSCQPAYNELCCIVVSDTGVSCRCGERTSCSEALNEKPIETCDEEVVHSVLERQNRLRKDCSN